MLRGQPRGRMLPSTEWLLWRRCLWCLSLGAAKGTTPCVVEDHHCRFVESSCKAVSTTVSTMSFTYRRIEVSAFGGCPYATVTRYHSRRHAASSLAFIGVRDIGSICKLHDSWCRQSPSSGRFRIRWPGIEQTSSTTEDQQSCVLSTSEEQQSSTAGFPTERRPLPAPDLLPQKWTEPCQNVLLLLSLSSFYQSTSPLLMLYRGSRSQLFIKMSTQANCGPRVLGMTLSLLPSAPRLSLDFRLQSR